MNRNLTEADRALSFLNNTHAHLEDSQELHEVLMNNDFSFMELFDTDEGASNWYSGYRENVRLVFNDGSVLNEDATQSFRTEEDWRNWNSNDYSIGQ